MKKKIIAAVFFLAAATVIFTANHHVKKKKVIPATTEVSTEEVPEVTNTTSGEVTTEMQTEYNDFNAVDVKTVLNGFIYSCRNGDGKFYEYFDEESSYYAAMKTLSFDPVFIETLKIIFSEGAFTYEYLPDEELTGNVRSLPEGNYYEASAFVTGHAKDLRQGIVSFGLENALFDTSEAFLSALQEYIAEWPETDNPIKIGVSPKGKLVIQSLSLANYLGDFESFVSYEDSSFDYNSFFRAKE